MLKRIISVILAVSLCFCVGLCAQAGGSSNPLSTASESTVQPRYQYANTVATTLGTSGGKALCAANLTGLSSVTKVKTTMTLQKKTLFWWNEVETWTKTVDGRVSNFEKTVSVESGTYRVKAVYVVYSGSASEEITAYSPDKKF